MLFHESDRQLLRHLARTQQAQGRVLFSIGCMVQQLLEKSHVQIDPELVEALAESDARHKALKAALDAQMPDSHDLT